MKRNELKIERLKKSHKKEIIIGVLVVLGIVATITMTTSKAKYRTTQVLPLVEGEITYTPYDFKIMAMYKSDDGVNYTEITDRMPSTGYTINESKSYCTIDNVNHDTEARLYTNENGEHVIANLKKIDKCYIWFDKKVNPTITILDGTSSYYAEHFNDNDKIIIRYSIDDGNIWQEAELKIGNNNSIELPIGAKVYNNTSYSIDILNTTKQKIGYLSKTTEYIITGNEAYYEWTGCNGGDCVPAI